MTQQHPSSAVPFDMLNMKQLCDIVHDDYEGSSDCDMLIAIIKKELIDGFALAESSDKDLLDLGITSYGHRKRLLMLAKQTSVVIPTRQPEDPMSRGGDAHGRSPFYSDGEQSDEDEDETVEQAHECGPVSQLKQSDDDEDKRTAEQAHERGPVSQLKTPLHQIRPTDNQEMPTLQQQLDKIRKIPDRLAGWEETFEIPSNFSHDTNVALATKRLTSAARGEIVRTITAKMISICAYPTAKQVDVVASRLVEEYDVRDRIGLGYSSFARSMGNRLRNMRAKRNSKHLDLADLGPCPKKARNQPHHRGLPLGGDLDAETYDCHLKQLSKERGRGIEGRDAALTLMKETANNRRRWITEERPPVKEIIQKFHFLKETAFLLDEFEQVVGVAVLEHTDGDNADFYAVLDEWMAKTIAYCKNDTRSEKKQKVLKLLDTENKKNDIYILELLALLLDKRKKNASDYLFCCAKLDDMEYCINNSPIVTPYILQVKDKGCYCIVAEGEILCEEMASLKLSLIALLAAFYAFGISFPQQCRNTYLFLEKVIFKINSGPPMSPIAVGMIRDISLAV